MFHRNMRAESFLVLPAVIWLKCSIDQVPLTCRHELPNSIRWKWLRRAEVYFFRLSFLLKGVNEVLLNWLLIINFIWHEPMCGTPTATKASECDIQVNARHSLFLKLNPKIRNFISMRVHSLVQKSVQNLVKLWTGEGHMAWEAERSIKYYALQ